MRVVLLDDIVNVGEAGAVVEVKNGYARNYLIPNSLAEPATADAVNRVGLIQRAAESKRAKRRSEAAGKFQRLDGQSITISVKAGTAGRIFGSITSALIVEEVKKQLGVTLDRRHVMLEEPLRHLGEFSVPLRAAADVTGEVRVLVEPEGGARGRGRSVYGGTQAAKEVAAEADTEPVEGAEAASGGAEGAETDAGTAETAEGAPQAAAEAEEATVATEPTPEPYEDLETEVAG